MKRREREGKREQREKLKKERLREIKLIKSERYLEE